MLNHTLLVVFSLMMFGGGHGLADFRNCFRIERVYRGSSWYE